MPTIVLGQDEVDCFAAWVSAEAGLPEHVENGSDLKVRLMSVHNITTQSTINQCHFQINYGSLLLQALLEHWSQTHAHLNDDVIKGNEYFAVPKHTPVIFR